MMPFAGLQGDLHFGDGVRRFHGILGDAHARRGHHDAAHVFVRIATHEERSRSIDEELDLDGGDPMQAMQKALSDPEVLLGAVRSPEQTALAPVLDAATAAVVGFVDYTVDSVAARIIGGDALRIAEAVRRRRVEAGADDVFIERLLGLQVTPALVQRGKAFVAGVVDRAGEAGLTPLFTRAGALPTPAELDAPGLWLARIEL
jgi:uncharacterized protein (DUF2342 family)